MGKKTFFVFITASAKLDVIRAMGLGCGCSCHCTEKLDKVILKCCEGSATGPHDLSQAPC